MKNAAKKLDDIVKDAVYANRGLMEFLLLFLLVYAMLDAVIVAWFFATPLLAQTENRLSFGLGMLAYNIGYLTSNCHQMPERSIIIAGLEMPFCARDTAIYVGCLFGALAPFYLRIPRFGKSLAFAVALIVPMAVDGVSQTIFSMRESSNLLRILTGLLFGYGLVYYLAVRIVENSPSMSARTEAKKVVVMGALTLVILLAAAYVEGGAYVTEKEAISRSGMSPTFVTYATKRMLHTIHYDPYFDTYQDPILTAIYEYGPQDHGAWVLYEGPIGHEGKYAFFSGAGGKVKMIPDGRIT